MQLTAQHAARQDDLENRLRRNNVQAIAILEHAEGKNPVAFIENGLISVFGKYTFSPMFSVEKAHRVPACPLPPGIQPHPFLFKLLNCKE